MAGEDVLIRVGVDYSSAIASTRQFESELRRILAQSAQGAIASAVNTVSSAVASKVALPQGATNQLSAVPDYSRELASINKNLEVLVQLTRANANRTIVFSEGPRPTPVAVSAPPPIVTLPPAPRPAAAPVAPSQPVQVSRPVSVQSYGDDRASRELAAAQTAYANTLRQLANRGTSSVVPAVQLAPVRTVPASQPAPQSVVQPRMLPTPPMAVPDTSPLQAAMASVVLELQRVRTQPAPQPVPQLVGGPPVASQMAAEMAPLRAVMSSLVTTATTLTSAAATLSNGFKQPQIDFSRSGCGYGSGGYVGGYGGGFGGVGGSFGPPSPPNFPSQLALPSMPQFLGLPKSSVWDQVTARQKRWVEAWVKKHDAELGQGPSGPPIVMPNYGPVHSRYTPIVGTPGPYKPDAIFGPPGPVGSLPRGPRPDVIETTAVVKDVAAAQRDYATSLRRASDATSQQAARYVDLKTIQHPPVPWNAGKTPSFFLPENDKQRLIQEFDRLPGDSLVTVYHGTSRENAQSLLGTGKVQRRSRDDEISSSTRSDKLYVAPTYKDALPYAGSTGTVLRLLVRRDDVIPSPEAGGKTVGSALFHSFEGATLNTSRLQNFRIEHSPDLPVLARQQQLLDRQIAYETAAVRGPSSGQIPLPTQSATLRDRLALDSGKESRASAEIVLAKDGLSAEYRKAARQLRAKAEIEERSVLPSSGKTHELGPNDGLYRIVDYEDPRTFTAPGVGDLSPVEMERLRAAREAHRAYQTEWYRGGRPSEKPLYIPENWLSSNPETTLLQLKALTEWRKKTRSDRPYGPFMSETSNPATPRLFIDSPRTGRLIPNPEARALISSRAASSSLFVDAPDGVLRPNPRVAPPLFSQADVVRMAGDLRKSMELGLRSMGGGRGTPPPPPPPGTGGAFGDDDDEIRRQKLQYINYLRQLNAQARRALTAGAQPLALPKPPEQLGLPSGPIRDIDRLRALEKAYDERNAGNDVAYRSLVTSVIPKGFERAGYMLSNDPFGRRGFDQALIRDIVAQRRALSAGLTAPLALPASTAYGPEYRKPIVLPVQHPTHGVIEVGDENWRSRERAKLASERTIRDESGQTRPPIGLKWRQEGDTYQGVLGSGKNAVPINIRLEREIEGGKPVGTRVISDEGETYFPGYNTVGQAKRYAESLESARVRVRESELAAAEATKRKAEQTAKGFFDADEVREAAESRVTKTQFGAEVDKEVLSDDELRRRQQGADADNAIAAEARRRAKEQELINRGRPDLIPQTRRAEYGIGTPEGLTPENQIKSLETRSKELSKAVASIPHLDLGTKEGQSTLSAMVSEARKLRQEVESFEVPPGDAALGAAKARLRSSVDDSVQEVFHTDRTGETRAQTADRIKEQEKVSKEQAKADERARKEAAKAPIADLRNIDDTVAGLRTRMSNLKFNPDTAAAQREFEMLLALLRQMEVEADKVQVGASDRPGAAFRKKAGVSSNLIKARTEAEDIQAEFQRAVAGAQYEEEMAAWRKARASRSGGRKLWDWFSMSKTGEPEMPEGYVPSGPGGPGGGGPGGGGPGGPTGPDGPGGKGPFSRFLYNARNRGGALGFFETGALSTLRYGLPSMALYGSMRGISNATREAEEFHYTMTKVRAQLDDTFGSGSDQIFNHFKSNIINLAKETGVQADVLASLGMQFQGAFGAENIGGLSGQKLVEEQLDAAAKLSQVTKIPAKELTDGLTAASFGFNRTNKDIGDMALRLESISGVTANETIGFIGDIAPVAKEAGFSLEELSSLAAIAQQKSGRSGTALAESFGRILPAIMASKDKLIELADADSKLQEPEFLKALTNNDVKTTILFLLKNYGELSKTSQTFVDTALGGRREAQALLSAVGDPGQLDRYVAELSDSGGTLEKRFKSAQGTLTNQLARLREEFNLFIASIIEGGLGDFLSGMISALGLVVRGFEGILKVAGGINDFFGGLPGKIMGLVAALVVLRTAANFIGGHVGGMLRAGLGVAEGTPLLSSVALNAGRWWGATSPTVPASAATGLGSFGNRIRAARTAFAGDQLLGVAEPGAGAGGLKAAVTAFFDVSTTTMAVAGGALIALGATYLAIRHSLDNHRREAENIASWAKDSKTSAEDIENLIKSPESDGGPGFFTSIWGAITGKRYLGVRDQYRAELARKQITTQEADRINRLNSSYAENQIDEIIEGAVGIRVPDTDRSYRTPADRREARLRASVAKKRLADTTKDVRDFFGGVEPGAGTAADVLEGARRNQRSRTLLGRNPVFDWVSERLGFDTDTSDETFDAAEKTLSRFAQLAGVRKSKLTAAVAKALGSGNAKAELQKVIETGSSEEVAQAKTASLNLAKDDKNLDTSVRVDKDIQTIETITKNYKSGVIGFTTYVERVRANLKALRDNIAKTGGTDDQRQRQAQGIAELGQEISRKAVDATQFDLDNLQLVGGVSKGDMAKAKVTKLSERVKSGKLFGDQRLDVLKQLLTAQQEVLADAIENAGSSEEVDKILAEGMKIDPSTRVNAIIGGIGKLNGNWASFTETFKNSFGETAGAFVSSLVNGLDSGSMTIAEVRAIIVDRIRQLEDRKKNLLRKYAGGKIPKEVQSQIDAITEAENVLQGEVSSIDTTGHLTNDPGNKVDPDKQIALQSDTKRIQSQLANRQVKLRGDAVAKAKEATAAAREAYERTKELTPSDENAIRDAETKVLEAEAAERDAVRDRSKAFVDRTKLFAQARHDSVAAATAEVTGAMLDLQAAREEKDPAAIARAEGNLAVAQDSRRQAQVNLMAQFMELGKVVNSKGDTVQDAVADRDIAQMRLNNAVGDDRIQAMIDLKKAEDGIRQALIGRWKSLVELQKLQRGDDPLTNAQADMSVAQQQLAMARNADEQIEAQKAYLIAEKQVADAMKAIRNSRYELRQAELNAMGDEVGAQMVAAQLSRAQLAEAIQATNQGKGPGEAELNRLRAAVVTADKAASDAALQDKLSDYDFLYKMNKITRTEYVNYLEGLKSTLVPGTKQFKDLELTIKGLKDDIAGGLQMNLPTSLALPTLYEARRLTQIGEKTGGAGTYNDSRTYNVIVNVDSSMSQQDLISALNNAMGNGVVGSDVRLY